MKKTTTSILLLMATLGSTFAQQVWQDYEGTSLPMFEFVRGSAYAEVANPDVTGVNTSANCAMYTRSAARFDNFEINHTNTDLTDYMFGATKTITMDIKAPVVAEFTFEVKISFQDSLLTDETTGNTSMNGVIGEFVGDVPADGDWHTVSFVFSPESGRDFDADPKNVNISIVLLGVDNEEQSANEDWYIDNWNFQEETVVASIEETLANVNITTFPNPVVDELNVTIPQELTNTSVKLSVTDVIGNEVLSEMVSNSSNLDISTLNGGIYILHMETAEGIQVGKSVKIVKE